MTLNLFKKISDIESSDKLELLEKLEEYKNDGKISLIEYASVKADINRLYSLEKSIKLSSASSRQRYTKDEVCTVQKSNLDVYDGIKNVSAHVNLMRQLFGEDSSQVRNGVQYNKRFFKTLDFGEPSIGHSMPSNWADCLLKLVKDRPIQFQNTLIACRKIYEHTNNNSMLEVIKKWSTYSLRNEEVAV